MLIGLNSGTAAAASSTRRSACAHSASAVAGSVVCAAAARAHQRVDAAVAVLGVVGWTGAARSPRHEKESRNDDSDG